MRNTSWLKTGAKNIALLAVGFLPLFLLLAGVLARAAGAESGADVIGTAFVLYPGLLAPVLTGGVLYLVCVFAAVRRLQAQRRAVAVALTPLIALGFLPFGMGHMLTVSHFLIAFALCLLAFGLTVRIPQSGVA